MNPLHLASTLISDTNGILFQAISNVGGEEQSRSAEGVLKQELKKLATQSPPPNDIPANSSIVKLIRRAQAHKSCAATLI